MELHRQSSVGVHFATVQLAFLGLMFVSQTQGGEHDAYQVVSDFARFVVYLLTSRSLKELGCLLYFLSQPTSQLNLRKILMSYRLSWLVFGAASSILLMSGQRFLDHNFLMLLAGYLVTEYLNMEQKPVATINYGTGMACSFFEGYLALVLPSDGAHNPAFVDKIKVLENSERIVFPVKKLLLVVTKSLFCPPDLKHFNKPDRPDLPQIEACNSPEALKRDVAGVKNRKYRNTAYKIWWPDASQPTVYVTVECPTPLHTLYRVLQRRHLYRELCDVDMAPLVEDFCTQLTNIIDRSDECRGRCELIYFDDTKDSDEYLPLEILKHVARLEPDYKGIIERHAQLYSERISEAELPTIPAPGSSRLGNGMPNL